MSTQPLDMDAVTARIQEVVRKDRAKPKPKKPWLFIIRWDNSKVKSVNSWTHASKYDKHEAEGTIYTNGRVGLDTGVAFESRDEMETHYGLAGWYEIRPIDGQESEQ